MKALGAFTAFFFNKSLPSFPYSLILLVLSSRFGLPQVAKDFENDKKISA